MSARIGVFGGSFDPPHLAHKALVEEALHGLKLDEVWVLPVGIAVHRSLTSYISAEQRLAWVQAMFADMPQVRVLDWEVKQGKPVAAIETMRWVNEQLDSVPIWLMGMDAWLGLPAWLAYPEHMKYCNVAVFSRHAEHLVVHDGWNQVNCISDFKTAQLCWLQALLPDVSATQIRKDILTGHDVSTVLDARVVKEIQTAYQSLSSKGVRHE